MKTCSSIQDFVVIVSTPGEPKVSHTVSQCSRLLDYLWERLVPADPSRQHVPAVGDNFDTLPCQEVISFGRTVCIPSNFIRISSYGSGIFLFLNPKSY